MKLSKGRKCNKKESFWTPFYCFCVNIWFFLGEPNQIVLNALSLSQSAGIFPIHSIPLSFISLGIVILLCQTEIWVKKQYHFQERYSYFYKLFEQWFILLRNLIKFQKEKKLFWAFQNALQKKMLCSTKKQLWLKNHSMTVYQISKG